MGLSATGCGGGQKPSDDAKGDRPRPEPRPTPRSWPTGTTPVPEDLPERLAADGTTIVVGDPDAPVACGCTRTRGARCARVRSQGRRAGAAQGRGAPGGEDRVRPRLSFLDDRVGGSGSKKAVNALRAALDAGKFASTTTCCTPTSPRRASTGFTDAYLLKLAGRVEGLRGPAFDSAVKTMEVPVVRHRGREGVRAGGRGGGTGRAGHADRGHQRRPHPGRVQRCAVRPRGLRHPADQDPEGPGGLEGERLLRPGCLGARRF